ncbi:hypothetical protein TREMEDRAFT_27638 [Tremella mesenterica DSM 1558]|uniref:uncharacterized protein n=1 Tax=Tremella mesenterica (strain ATCC 24925 / CBS 8224 / DSM 1558 / NBRC 9311 / NRRL Y-6157 / RJB 2259-6 / UBC 559-6) TaxID=578456 RepID=UPI0003F494F6|nr:uncharacterized protein TREMEDRAFT_27638 [Tremella mesenterica DSM 1558]EIW71667.1 hypothetical protein TREMEDRAFT_27638 [Tremella mesenterica DSM 1558]
MATNTAGPSRPFRTPASLLNTPPPPSTSGDSESTNQLPTEKPLNLQILSDLAKSALVESLNEIQGAKTLILDPGLAGPLGLVTDVALLKHQAVDKIFWLEPGPLNVSTRNVVWLCRPKMSHMKTIAEQIKAQQSTVSSNGPLVYTLLLVPRATELCKKVLEDEGVAGDLTIGEYKLEFIPVEEDLISLELDNVAKDIFMNGDDTPLYYSSSALMNFQRAFGMFPRIMGKGDAAKRLTNLLQRHCQSGEEHYSDLELSTEVDGLIIIDRSVDWVTPMCTQLTYEGMLDEFIGIRNAHIEVDPVLIDPQNTSNTTTGQPPQKKRKHHLNGQKDKLLGEIRDLNFAVVGTRLSKVARRLEGDYGGAKNLKSVSQMKAFVGKLGGLQGEQQSLKLHTGLTEILMPITRTEEFNKSLEAQQNLVAGYDLPSQLNTIDDLMAQQAPWATVLRSLVLMSIVSGGIKPKILESVKKDFLQVHGYHHLPLLISLEKLGLLVKSPSLSSQPFPTLRKSLRLVVDDVDDTKPNDISYVYSGYAPISVRLVQCAVQKNAVLSTGMGVDGDEGKREIQKAHPLVGWRGFEDVLGSIPGATVDIRQRLEGSRHEISREKETITTVVFFLGGCTYTEISALRWMAKQVKGRKFVIATTGMINGTTLLESFGDPEPVPLISHQR